VMSVRPIGLLLFIFEVFACMILDEGGVIRGGADHVTCSSE